MSEEKIDADHRWIEGEISSTHGPHYVQRSLGAFWPLEWKLVIAEAARRQGSCITCSAWWSRKNRCTAAAEGNGPGRHWHASEVAKPPWCPGWRPKPTYDDVVK